MKIGRIRGIILGGLGLALLVLSRMPSPPSSGGEEPRRKTTVARMGDIQNALTEYYSHSNRYPSRLDDLMELAPARMLLGETNEHTFVAAWGSPIVYGPTKRDFDLFSLGPDRTAGTKDDIRFVRWNE